jgi:hypothetical protein
MNEAVRSTKLQDMPMLIGGKLVASESGRWMSDRPHAGRHRQGRQFGGRGGGSHYPVIPERSATLQPWLPVPAAANKLR